jgi:hypothetical protein
VNSAVLESHLSAPAVKKAAFESQVIAPVLKKAKKAS